MRPSIICALMAMLGFPTPGWATATPQRDDAPYSTKVKHRKKHHRKKKHLLPARASTPPELKPPVEKRENVGPGVAQPFRREAPVTPPALLPENRAEPMRAVAVSSHPTGFFEGKPHRMALVGAVFLGAGGLAMGYWARGEARRSQSLPGASDVSRTLQNSRTAGASANLLYALAILTAGYGIAVEFQ